MESIPLFKVFMSPDAKEDVGITLDSGFITQGPKVDEFEKQLINLFDHPYILTLNSATSGLTLALRLLEAPDPETNWPGLEPNDTVLTTPLTCTATNWAILAHNKYNLQWVDVDPNTCNMCLDSLSKSITPKTKVIYVVHWGGTPIDLGKLNLILDAKQQELGFRPRIVEDCAHAFMSMYDKRYLGTHPNHPNICVYSLQAIKHLTSGDGGLIFLPTQKLYDRAKLIRWFGIDRDKRNFSRKDFRLENDIAEWGYKFHMNDINATIGLANLKHITNLVNTHKLNAYTYNQKLHAANLKHFTLLQVPKKVDSAYWIYTIKCNADVGAFIAFMASRHITVSQVHRRNDVHSCVKQYTSQLPNLDSIQDQYVCIPTGWWLEPKDVDRIVNAIIEFDRSLEPESNLPVDIRPLDPNDYFLGFLDVMNVFTRNPKHVSYQEFYEYFTNTTSQNAITLVAVTRPNPNGGEPSILVGVAKVLFEYKPHNNLSTMAHIEDVAVHPFYRKNNIGTKLVQRCVDICKKRLDCYKIVLCCKPELTHFYERNGFSTTGTAMTQYLI